MKLSWEEKLYRALEELICNCVDVVGCVKKPSPGQIKKAQNALWTAEREIKRKDKT